MADPKKNPLIGAFRAPVPGAPPGTPAPPEAGKPPAAGAAKPMERVRALTDQLEAGITDLFQSDQYAAYLQSLSKLHRYSYGNIFLIKLQCPHASMVAGYGDWKRKFGRHVKAGETGITILAPCPYWARDEVEETGPDGQTVKEQKWVKKTGFTTVPFANEFPRTGALYQLWNTTPTDK